MVCPIAACSALAGKSERQFLASRFYIEWLVTSHDPSVIAFSDRTSIHETLNVGRRWPDDRPKPPTKVVALRKIPNNLDVSSRLADTLNADSRGEAVATGAGRVWEWPAHQISRGNWNVLVWSSKKIAQVATDLGEHSRLVRLDWVDQTPVTGQSTNDVFEYAELIITRHT